MNRLYKPKTAVGEVLLAIYATLGGGRDRAEEWQTLYKSERMTALRRRIADLSEWGAPGADDLAGKLKALDGEAAAPFLPDYTAMFHNFEVLDGRSQAVHADWREYGELREFMERYWKKVSELYATAKRIPPAWVGPKLAGEMAAADKAFLAEFGKPDYRAAIDALNRLILAMKAVAEAAIPVNKEYKQLAAQTPELKSRQQKVEDKVQSICERMPPADFFAKPAGQAVLRMRLRRSQVVALLDGPPQAAVDPMAAWGKAIDEAGPKVDQFLAGLGDPSAATKPDLGEEIELADMAMDFKPIALVPDEVTARHQQAADLVAPKGDTGEPTIAQWKLEVDEAYKALDRSEDEKDKGPLFDAFQKAFGELMQAAGRWNQVTGPAAELAGKRVAELQAQGLLKAMRVDEKLDLLTKLRGSCEPMVSGGPFNQKLTELGLAQAQLLASFEQDEEFREHDRQRRQATVKSLVADEGQRKELKQALDEWSTLEVPQRLKLCERLVAAQCTTLKIDACPLRLKTEGKETAGYFSPADRAIFINDHQESAFHYSFEAVSNTLFHEVSHWWQHVQVERLERGEIKPVLDGKPNPEFLQIELFARNHGSAHPGAYVSSTLGKDLYKQQPMEAHAYEVGDEMQQLLMAELLA